VINVQWSQAATEDLLNSADGLYLVDFDLADALLSEAERATFWRLRRAPARWSMRMGCENGVWASFHLPCCMM